MQELFQNALSSSPIGDLGVRTCATVCLTTGSVTLEGVMSSYYGKQIAQEVCLPLAKEHGLKLVNNILVEKP